MATMPGAVRALPFLITIALLAGCGGGDGSALSGATATRPAPTATRPGVTATRPERTQPAVTATTPEPEPTAPATTEAVETGDTDTESAAPPITLTQTTITPTIAPTVTLTATETQTQTQTQVPTEPETTAETESVAVASSSDDTPWGWILLGAALVVAAVAIGAYAIRRRRAGVALDRHADDLARRTLTTLDDVRVQGSIVTGSVQALAGEARSLEHRAGDDAVRHRLARLGAGLEGLAHALETDRNLRLASPPASEAQLNYSTSLIRRHVDEVDALLRHPPGPYASPVS
jgi:hypothetical protein